MTAQEELGCWSLNGRSVGERWQPNQCSAQRIMDRGPGRLVMKLQTWERLRLTLYEYEAPNIPVNHKLTAAGSRWFLNSSVLWQRNHSPYSSFLSLIWTSRLWWLSHWCMSPYHAWLGQCWSSLGDDVIIEVSLPTSSPDFCHES